MIIVAILKHVAGKSADYGAALDYLKYEHDEVLKKPLLDANGNWVLRRDILLEGINCEPELFDVECEMLNAQYHKNQNYDEIKTHHYLISFDPADKDECGLTGEQAQAIVLEANILGQAHGIGEFGHRNLLARAIAFAPEQEVDLPRPVFEALTNRVQVVVGNGRTQFLFGPPLAELAQGREGDAHIEEDR